jgi:hypothetical protein
VPSGLAQPTAPSNRATSWSRSLELPAAITVSSNSGARQLDPVGAGPVEQPGAGVNHPFRRSHVDQDWLIQMRRDQQVSQILAVS